MDTQLYYKVMAGETVISDCQTILLDGVPICAPTAEMIAEAGWLPYVPPVVPASPQDEPGYEDVVGAVKKQLSASIQDLSDEDALAVAALYPTWTSKLNQDPLQAGDFISEGDRLWDDGELWKCITPHNALRNWRPRESPSLFTTVSIEEWPEYRQPTGAHDAYNRGDKVTFEGHHYICKMDGTTFSPAEYPAAWELVP